MNAFYFIIRLLTRIAFLAIAYLVAKILFPENALWWALGAYWFYFLLAWSVVLVRRKTLVAIETLELGANPPRFRSPSSILIELELASEKINNQESGYIYRSHDFPIVLDEIMDDILNSISRMDHNKRTELFDALSKDEQYSETSKHYNSAFWSVIMRLASRAVRDDDNDHIVRSIYAAQAALVSGADYRDVLVSYGAVWDAARRQRVHIKPVTQEISMLTPELNAILTSPIPSLKSMSHTTKKDEHGFRYDYDDSW